MASIISAGTSAGTALNLTGDTSGILQLASNNGTVGLTLDASQNLTYVGALTGGTGVVNLGSGQFYKDASGNVGIGVTPSAWASGTTALQVKSVNLYSFTATNNFLNTNAYYDGANWLYQSTNTAVQYQLQEGAHVWKSAVSGTSGTAITWLERMRIDSSGNVGIGTSSPSAKLEVSGQRIRINNASDPGLELSASSVVKGYVFYDTANNLVTVRHASSTGINLDSSGNLLVGATSPLKAGTSSFVNGGGGSGTLSLKNTGSARYWYIGPNSNGDYVNFNDAGTGMYMNYGATSWTGTSDERLKENLVPITNATNKVSTLRAVTGNYISDKEKTSRSFLIAQDVQKVLPEAVTAQNDEIGTLGLSYTDVIPLLVAAIQEQQALIDNLTTRLAALEGAK